MKKIVLLLVILSGLIPAYDHGFKLTGSSSAFAQIGFPEQEPPEQSDSIYVDEDGYTWVTNPDGTVDVYDDYGYYIDTYGEPRSQSGNVGGGSDDYSGQFINDLYNWGGGSNFNFENGDDEEDTAPDGNFNSYSGSYYSPPPGQTSSNYSYAFNCLIGLLGLNSIQVDWLDEDLANKLFIQIMDASYSDASKIAARIEIEAQRRGFLPNLLEPTDNDAQAILNYYLPLNLVPDVNEYQLYLADAVHSLQEEYPAIKDWYATYRANKDLLDNLAPKPVPSAADKITIGNIIRDHDSWLWGLFPGSGEYINYQVTSSGTNFGYNAFWRQAHSIPPHSYTGALGIVGEGIMAYSEKKHWADQASFYGNQFITNYTPHEKGQKGTYDFMISLYANGTVPGTIGNIENAADGSQVVTNIPFNTGDDLRIFYEIKTNSSNTNFVSLLADRMYAGFDQTIRNLTLNASSNYKTLGIIICDYDAYMKTYNDSPYFATMQYNRLKAAGGSLKLVHDLFTTTAGAVDDIMTQIKNNTSH